MALTVLSACILHPCPPALLMMLTHTKETVWGFCADACVCSCTVSKHNPQSLRKVWGWAHPHTQAPVEPQTMNGELPHGKLLTGQTHSGWFNWESLPVGTGTEQDTELCGWPCEVEQPALTAVLQNSCKGSLQGSPVQWYN